jgi:hypothetical protein
VGGIIRAGLRAKCCGCTEAFQASRAGSIPVARLESSRARLGSESHGEWRSLVAHPAGGRAVAGSNPVSPTTGKASNRAKNCGLLLEKERPPTGNNFSDNLQSMAIACHAGRRPSQGLDGPSQIFGPPERTAPTNSSEAASARDYLTLCPEQIQPYKAIYSWVWTRFSIPTHQAPVRHHRSLQVAMESRRVSVCCSSVLLPGVLSRTLRCGDLAVLVHTAPPCLLVDHSVQLGAGDLDS